MYEEKLVWFQRFDFLNTPIVNTSCILIHVEAYGYPDESGNM